jgi:uncharacterized protein YecT (DUF1311 family)
MRHIRTASIALAVLASAGAAQAEELCRGAEVNDMLKECLYRHYLVKDRLMSDAHSAALLRVETSKHSKPVIRDWTRVLQESQRAWIAFRDTDCGRPIRFEMMQQPELIGIKDLRCRIALTDERLGTLKARYQLP